MWAPIIAQIIAVLGPLLLEWLSKWLESRLQKAARSLGDVTSFSTEAQAAGILFDQAIDDLPRFALVRRLFLQTARNAAVNAANNSGVVKGADAALLRTAVSAIDTLD